MGMTISTPQVMACGSWHFPVPILQDLRFEVQFLSGHGRTPGRYYQLYQGQLGGVGIYLGFQSDIVRPDVGGQGKGLIFSRWGSRDRTDAAASDAGWVESAGHEGDFVGVRSLFEWGLGRYTCWLQPTRQEANATWYEFRVRRHDDVTEATAGALRFSNINGHRPLIHSGGSTWTEVYSPAEPIDHVPMSHLNVWLYANGNTMAPTRCDVTYNPKFPWADAYCTKNGMLSLRSGNGVSQQYPPRQYPIHVLFESLKEYFSRVTPAEAQPYASDLYWLTQPLGAIVLEAYRVVYRKKFCPTPARLEAHCSDCRRPGSKQAKSWHDSRRGVLCADCRRKRSAAYEAYRQEDELRRQEEERRQELARIRLWQLKTMPYFEYLQTPEWQATRRQMLERALFRCQLCNANGLLDVHHRTYERRGEEWEEDLIVLCRRCHQKHHDKLPKADELSLV